MPIHVLLSPFCLHAHFMCSSISFQPQANLISSSMGGYPPNPPAFSQAPGLGYPAPHGGYGAPLPNQQVYGLYSQPGGPMQQQQQPQHPPQGYPGQPGQPGQPMPGYGGAPAPSNPSMPGYGGAPGQMPAYPKVPSPNPSMPGYGGGGAMPVAPAMNVSSRRRESMWTRVDRNGMSLGEGRID